MKEVNKGTQAATILNHLQVKKFLTTVEANGLYAINQLPYVVHTLRNKGYDIVGTRKQGIKASYMSYTLNKS